MVKKDYKVYGRALIPFGALKNRNMRAKFIAGVIR
jgi:hypothetical protein